MTQKILTVAAVTLLFITVSCNQSESKNQKIETTTSKTEVKKAKPFKLLVDNVDNIGSLRFTLNETGRHEYAKIDKLPATFGVGEFTLEFWIKPDATFPVGYTPEPQVPYPDKITDIDHWATHPAQLVNWADTDNEPYSMTSWWWEGNWIIDGFARGYGHRDGTIGVQMYGGGRLRWFFDDGTGPSEEKGFVYSVGVYPATETPSLLDGKWHNIQCVRRWVGKSAAQLELWIDGALIATTEIPTRVDMHTKYWSGDWGIGNPPGLKGWFIGGEEQASSGVLTEYDWHQLDDYKGLFDELRLWDRAKTDEELKNNFDKAIRANNKGLVGHYSFDNANTPGRYLVQENINKEEGQVMSLTKFGLVNLSPENAPVK